MKRITRYSIFLMLVFSLSFAENIQQSSHYVASKKSTIYHKPSCRWAKKIKKSNKIVFTNVKDAKASGYRACKVCKPPKK